MSEKQANRLENCYKKKVNSSVKDTVILGVFDGDRFVWAGIEYPDFSDREWLENTFKAEYTDRFVITKPEIERHIPDKIEPVNIEPDANLIR
jgi:hypothetical protein